MSAGTKSTQPCAATPPEEILTVVLGAAIETASQGKVLQRLDLEGDGADYAVRCIAARVDVLGELLCEALQALIDRTSVDVGRLQDVLDGPDAARQRRR